MIAAAFRRLAAPRALAGISLVEGLVLGAGLEACFGEPRYRLIMALGMLGGLGIGVLTRAGLTAWDAGKRDRAKAIRIWSLAAGPALAVFALWCLVRVLPLIREELAYRI